MAKETKKKKPAKRQKKAPRGTIPRRHARSADSQAEAAIATSPAASAVIDRLWRRIEERRADPSLRAHSARLLARGTQSVLQKLGEELVEFMIEAIAGDRKALVLESADVVYHLLIAWVNAGIEPEQVWAELATRERLSYGAQERAHTTKIP